MLINETGRLSARQALNWAEARLREALAAADAAPFLGHHDLPSGAGKALRVELDRKQEPLAARLRLLFYLWPALTVTWVANTVAKRYGSIAQMELYPHLEELFGTRIDATSRKRIAGSFRHACRRLDLPLPRDAEPVDTYVVQAGVPEAQIGVLARAFSVAERREGLPDTDDDAAVGVFTQAAVAAVDIGHPRLKRVLEHDDAGWYARLWVTLRERPEELPDDFFASHLAETAQLEGEVRGSTFRRPHLLWRDNLLGIEVPGGSGLRWGFTLGHATRDVVGEAHPLVVPLSAPWPIDVSWSLVKPGARARETGTLELPRDPSELFLFAGATGRLVLRARFEPSQSDRPQRLPRGEYEAICTGRFLGPEEVEAASVGSLWSIRFGIADASVAFGRGALRAILAPLQRPALELSGTSIRDLHGTTVFADRGLRARVTWPDGTGTSQEKHEQGYELIVTGGGQTIERLALPETIESACVLDVGPYFEGSPPILRRVVLKLVRSGERRPIARTVAYVWIGLERVDGVGFLGKPPLNLMPTTCANLAIDGRRVALRTDRRYARARLAVYDADIAGRQHVFEFAYPGVIACLRWFDAEGRQHEEVLDQDAIVALRPGDGRLLDVTSPDPRAVLRIGATARTGAFVDRPRLTVPLASVLEACQGGADRLAVEGGDGLEVLLARFTVPCEVARWAQSHDRVREERSLLLGFREPLQQLRVRARDLWGGAKAEIVLEADALRHHALADGMSLRLERDFGDAQHSVRLIIEQSSWPSGLWLMDLDAQLGETGRWQAIANLRGDVFAWLLPYGLDSLLADDLSEVLGLADRLRILARCHKELQRCFALPCWQGGVDHILRIWRQIGTSLAADHRLAGCWPALLLLAFIEPPLEASESWLPIISLWEVLPEFMALPGANYAALAEIRRDDALVIATLSELAEDGSVGRFLMRWRLSPSFFGCFDNLVEVNASPGETECRRFDFKAYADRVRSDTDTWNSWSPGSEALSPLHYAFAMDGLVRRYRVIGSSAGNEQRIPGAARLAQAAARWLERDGHQRAKAWISELLIDRTPLHLPIQGQDDEDAFLLDAPAALSAIALICRLQSREAGMLEEFLKVVSGDAHSRYSVLTDINFLTSMGRDLFAFWMLFWEVLLTTATNAGTEPNVLS